MKKKFTKEEVLAFREATYKELLKLGEKEELAKREVGFDEDMSKEVCLDWWREVMEFNTPEGWAEMIMM